MTYNTLPTLKLTPKAKRSTGNRVSKKLKNKFIYEVLLGLASLLFVSYQIYELVGVYRFRL